MVVGAQAEDLDTVVIGSGPGGYVAAIRAAQLGQKVTVIENGLIGGVCLNVGCIPSKALINVGHNYQLMTHEQPYGLKSRGASLDWQKTQDWKQHKVVDVLTGGVAMLLKKNHVKVIRGSATFTDNEQINVVEEDSHELFNFKNIIIATGSHPVQIPSIPFGKRILDSTGALALKEIPKSLIVIGGGVIGFEIGSAYQNLGAKVTIIEGLDHVLNGFDAELIKPVIDDFKAKGGQIYTSAQANSAKQDDKEVSVEFQSAGENKTISADYLLVSVGRRPNTDQLGLNNTDIQLDDHHFIKTDLSQKTNVAHIYAIGDVTSGPGLAHKASFQAKIAAAAIAQAENAVDMHYSLPSVAYTDPELATTGETPTSVAEKKLAAKVFKFPFAANGRALAIDQAKGFVRVIVDDKSQAVIGAQIVGPQASELISQLSLAIENGLTVDDISLTIYPHPTLSESIMDLSELAKGLSINL
ncbi:dihydrolipoyl dehydrogenase [Oenococcus alcoholitolerans]|uniref:dihydrolipoyl dehydrogenase n=1 Tax=Oenococcus alcoholitolerans TaxID=931074 RepID=UPI003F7133CB